jgi:hypothetical protein
MALRKALYNMGAWAIEVSLCLFIKVGTSVVHDIVWLKTKEREVFDVQ